MIINNAGAPGSTLSQPSTSARSPASTFAAIVTAAAAATTSSPRPEGPPAQRATEKQNANPARKSETERLLKALHDYINKGPIVALREKILKSMNLTEEKLKTLPPEQQKAIETEIARKIREFLLEHKTKVDSPVP